MSDQMPSSLRDLLMANFSRQKVAAREPKETPRPMKPKVESQPIADVIAGASAQRFFNPAFKALNEPSKPPNEKLALRGTSNQMATSGAWGTPPEAEK